MNILVALGILSLLASVADGGVSMNNPFACYSKDLIRFVPHLMASLSSYEAIRPFNFTIVKYPYTPVGTATKLWYLGRNGALWPKEPFHSEMMEFAQSSVKADIVSNYIAGRTSLCRPDFEAIRNFTMEPDFVASPGKVVESGLIAMENIAKRLKQKYSDIFGQSYSRDRFLLRHTNTNQTKDSIRAFAKGLFGEAGSRNVIYEDVPTVDWFLNSFAVCPALSVEIANGKAFRSDFENGPEFEEMILQVNKKLGFNVSNYLSFDQIHDMWMWCQFDTAVKFEISHSKIGGNAPWCSAFSVGHQYLQEYSEDLAYFYQNGYGVENQRLIENLNCGLIQDLLTHMQSDNKPKARIYVTDEYEIQTMLVLLGVFRDVWPLDLYNFAEESNRRWRTSMISSFSANIAVVRYDCADGDHDLVFLLNEKPKLVPGCDQQTGVCKLSVIKNRFKRFANVNCSQVFCTSK